MQKLPTKKTYSGFTLVELIVVITILVILGTIAFINLGGFQSNARDSVRLENLTNLKKGLDIFQIKSGTYPMPENPVNITASGTLIGYQGFAKDQIGSIAKLSLNGTIDPLDSTIYTTYSTNADRTKMQLMSFLEDGSNVTAMNSVLPHPRGEGWGEGLIPQTFAASTSDYSKRYPSTQGDTLGILLGNSGITMNQPVQETGNGVDVVLTNTGYLAVFLKNNMINGTGVSLITAVTTYSPDGKSLSKYDTSLVGYWDMETLSGIKLKDWSGYGNDGIKNNGVIIAGVSGKSGKATSFDGIGGSSITIPVGLTNPELDIGGDVTISAWILGHGTSGEQVVVRNGTQADLRYGLFYYGTTSTPSFEWYNGTGFGYTFGKSNSVPLDLWSYVVVTRKNLISSFYVNGNLTNTASVTPAIIMANTLCIGSDCGPYIQAFSGSIDEVRIYNRALSDSEIQSLYNTTK